MWMFEFAMSNTGFVGAEAINVGANSLAMSALSVVPVHSQEIPSIKSMG
jgi:hypothetical protein